ncbi:MAG: DsbA family protein [Alphaproteobacteria bacterium]
MLTRREALAFAALATGGALLPRGRGVTAAEESEIVLGDPEAPVTIIEYSSFSCPHCADFHNTTLPKLKAAYLDTGKVRLIYRDFPLDRPAVLAAVMVRCADPSRAAGFIEVLFRTQERWTAATDPIEALARIAGLGGMSRQRFEACLGDQALIDRILAARLEGENEFGINRTPSFIINGKKYLGAMSFEQFEKILKPLLPQS